MLSRLLASMSLIVGAQLLSPPFLVDSFPISSFLANRATAAELSEIQSRGYLTVAIKNNRPPLGFIDEAGELSGFEIDIARRLAEDILGDPEAVRFLPVSNVERITAVLEDRADVAIAAVTLTTPRLRLVDFSDPYYLDGTAFIVASGPEPTGNASPETIEDLRVGTVALLERSSAIAHVRYILPGASLVGIDSYAEGQRLLNEGSIDAFAGDASVLAGWSMADIDRDTDYRLLPTVISVNPLAVVIPKGRQYDDLQNAINQSIRQWYAEAWLQERAEYWGLPSGILPSMQIENEAISEDE